MKKRRFPKGTTLELGREDKTGEHLADNLEAWGLSEKSVFVLEVDVELVDDEALEELLAQTG